jgi:hypothetical protein
MKFGYARFVITQIGLDSQQYQNKRTDITCKTFLNVNGAGMNFSGLT